MNDLLLTFSQLNETERRQLLAYADILLMQQKAKGSSGNVSEWKEKIKNVSTWTDIDVSVF